MKYILDKEDIIESLTYEENDYLVLDILSIKREYWEAKYQLYKFICDFTGMGTGKLDGLIGAYDCYTGEEVVIKYTSVLGKATKETLKEWKNIYTEAYENDI